MTCSHSFRSLVLNSTIRSSNSVNSILHRKCVPFSIPASNVFFTIKYLATTQCLMDKIKYKPSIRSKGVIKMIPPKTLAYTGSENFDDSITSADMALIENSESGVLEPCKEDVSDISPFASASFSLAAYANKSYTIQQLVKMGVDLSKVEKCKGAAESILKLDFDKHMKMHLRFLHDNGVPAEEFGSFVTKNPFIFEQRLEDLEVRVNYLEAKKFPADDISRIIINNPRWMNYSTIEIDKRLGFFQRTFVLSGAEVRHVATTLPKLITYQLSRVLESVFIVKEVQGFNEHEAKALLLKTPFVYKIHTDLLKSRFDYVHNIMGISHEQIVQQSAVLLRRDFITQQRHEFLKEIGKAQYDPKLPGYVNLETMVRGSDVDFCRNIAKTSIDVFNAYLKTC